MKEATDGKMPVAGAAAAAEATPQIEQVPAGAAAVGLALVAVPDQARSEAAAGGVPAAGAATEEVDDEELSELEDEEASQYLHTPEEAKLKEMIWVELNRDFLERQSAKAAALESAAAKVPLEPSKKLLAL